MKVEDMIEEETIDAPAYFVDLNLDQIVEAIICGREEYNLRPLYYKPLKDVDSILFRQEIMRDLECANLLAQVNSFAQKMHTMRAHLVQVSKLDNRYQKGSWFLDAVEIYCDAVSCLRKTLASANLESRGLSSFREYLNNYISSDSFNSLLSGMKELKTDLSMIKYCLLMRSDTVTIRRYESEIDYSAAIQRTFERFRHGAVKDYLIKLEDKPEMNQVEANVLEIVAQLFPDTFAGLEDYCQRKADYLDIKIAMFDREIQFYIAYLEYVATFRKSGLEFCYPRVTNTSKEIYDRQGFDAALALKLIGENSRVVTNDFHLEKSERVFVISGPNQGGKTTFARTFGQLHFMAALGCMVPGTEAKLFLMDGLFTHFEREETVKDLRGKLEGDLIRIRSILEQATTNSIVIINEIFTSTTLQDAVFLSKEIMRKIVGLGALCVWVTFVDELASFSKETVSMMSAVVPGNPALRTYKILRSPANGLSYAISIAEKYQLTYGNLRKRIKL